DERLAALIDLLALRRAEIAEVVNLADRELRIGPLDQRAALDPLDCVAQRRHVQNPKPGDDSPRLAERALRYGGLSVRPFDAGAACARMKLFRGDQDPGFDESTVVARHLEGPGGGPRLAVPFAF